MSNLPQVPPSPKKNPDWNDQVKLGRGRSDTGAFHRAIAVAVALFESGAWDGRGLLIVHEAYETHLKMEFYREALVEGADYEFASDTIYRRDEAAEALPACPFCGETGRGTAAGRSALPRVPAVVLESKRPGVVPAVAVAAASRRGGDAHQCACRSRRAERERVVSVDGDAARRPHVHDVE